MIQAVLFDLGETLINYEHIDIFATFAQAADETYKLLSEELKLPLPDFDKYHKYQLRWIRWAYLKSKITGREFNSLDMLRKCSLQLKIDVPEQFYPELAWRWYKPLADQSHVDPQAHSTLTELQARGLRLALISNTFVPATAHDRHLKDVSLLSFFPIRVYSSEFGLRKPKKQIFIHALSAIGVRPQEAVYVGDKMNIDIRGARRTGMYGILKSADAPAGRRDRKAFHVRKLAELPALIDQINNSVSRSSSYA